MLRRSKNPAVLEAINATLRSIEQRGRVYRNIVICVSLTFILSVLLAVGLWSWRPVIAMLFLLPISGLFLVLDGRQVRCWQANILQLWQFRGLKIEEFETVILSLGNVPRHTVEAMLAILPKENEQGEWSDEQKQTVSDSLLLAARSEERRILLAFFGLAAASASLAAAAVFHSAIFLVLRCRCGL
jgi:hypothetical protein